MTGSPTAQACLLYFDDERPAAERLAAASGLALRPVQRHCFPDGELKLTLPVDGAGQLPVRAVLLRSLYQPNDKLVELLLAARAARALGVRHLTLVAPYLAYMRQDIAFHPGEAVSQRIVGPFLASLFDAVVTVDPHLHRVATLPEAVPAAQAVVVSGAPLLADWIAEHVEKPLIVGPDEESEQWAGSIASRIGAPHVVLRKTRHGDRSVDIEVPDLSVWRDRTPVLVDDIASSGRTLAIAAHKLAEQGMRKPECVVVHALFAEDAWTLLTPLFARITSTDTVPHPSNRIGLASLIAGALSSGQTDPRT